VIDLLGYVGAFLLSASAVPQVVRAIRDGHARGLSRGLLACWLGGEACLLVWALISDPLAILLLNYGVNLALVSILAIYRSR
jgi:hypothetical protein